LGALKNNYFSIGFNDLRYLLAYDRNDTLSYNRVASESQQVLEKILKGIIEMCSGFTIFEKERLLKTHNLRKLGEAINKNFGTDINLSDLAYVKDFYYEARYPGDDFVEVDLLTRDRCIEIVKCVILKVIHLCPEAPNEVNQLLGVEGKVDIND